VRIVVVDEPATPIERLGKNQVAGMPFFGLKWLLMMD
jgi:hypothetical protein